MPRCVLIDEFHLSFLAPTSFSEAAFDAVRRTLDGARFRNRLRRIVRKAVARFRCLGGVRVRLSR